MKRILTSIGLGLLGVLVAVGVTMAASNLSSQSIGISAEPTTAGEQLAVPMPTTTTAPAGASANRESSPERTPPASRTAPTRPTVDDDQDADEQGGKGRGRGRGRGGDDRSESDRGEDSRGDSSGSGSGKNDDD